MSVKALGFTWNNEKLLEDLFDKEGFAPVIPHLIVNAINKMKITCS